MASEVRFSMGTILDIYKLQQNFQYLGVNCLIRRYYQQIDVTGGAADLVYQWINDVVPKIQVIVSTVCYIQTIEAENLNDSTDWQAVSLAEVGAQSSDQLPAYLAFGFAFPSSDKKIRAGACRIPGVTEDAVTAGVITPAYAAVMQDMADILADRLDSPLGRFAPVLYTPGNSKTAFAPFSVEIVNGFCSGLTTQNTRKS